jgi:hypothetical protein
MATKLRATNKMSNDAALAETIKVNNAISGRSRPAAKKATKRPANFTDLGAETPPVSSAYAHFKWPKKLAACADRYYTLKQKRLAMQKEVDALEEEEKALKDHLINNLPKAEATGVAGQLCRVSVVTKSVPQVQDWETFYKYIKRTGDFSLLHKRVSTEAVQERWDAGKAVPGVTAFNAVTLSVNKV